MAQISLNHPAFAISRMARLVQAIIKDTLDAYVASDSDKASEFWRRDEEVDEVYTGLFRELLTYMMEDSRNITPCTHLLFVARNIERMEGGRPKGDRSSFQVVTPPNQQTKSKAK